MSLSEQELKEDPVPLSPENGTDEAFLPFPDETLLEEAEKGDLESASRLDGLGFLIRPGETPEKYAARIRSIRVRAEKIQENLAETGSYEPYPGITVREERRIPRPILSEAARITGEKYGFILEWAPGYFPDKGLGPLWGGCAVADEGDDALPVFIIRNEFEQKERWFIYSRKELLSHEICHAARMTLHDRSLEEHFAYAVSGSPLRRTVGNCFQTDWDAILFVLPVLILLAAQIAINVFEVRFLQASWFWVGAFVWPAFLLLRNFFQREMYFHARNGLVKSGFRDSDAVLFRCTSEEIFGLARDGAGMILDPEAEFRFRLIAHRFH